MFAAEHRHQMDISVAAIVRGAFRDSISGSISGLDFGLRFSLRNSINKLIYHDDVRNFATNLRSIDGLIDGSEKANLIIAFLTQFSISFTSQLSDFREGESRMMRMRTRMMPSREEKESLSPIIVSAKAVFYAFKFSLSSSLYLNTFNFLSPLL